MSVDNKTRREVIIIGGGVFGLSSARYLLKDRSNDVTICDRSDDLAPSRDVSKILRIDYPDAQRMRDVIRSKHSWTSESVFQPFLYRTGRVVAYPPASIDTLDGIDRARSDLNLPFRERQTIALLKDRFATQYVQQDLSVVENDDDSILDWDGVMESVKQDCIQKGAKFREDTVLRMDVDGSGRVSAIVTSRESINTSNSEVILAAGPWIMPLLEASSMKQPPPSRSPVATGIFSYTLELSLDQWKKYRMLPALSEIGVGEFICHPTNVGSAKLTWITPFRNPSGEEAISMPWDASTSNLALQSMLHARAWTRQVIPGLKGARIRATHSWWDGVTDDQNPIIARHPQHQNLLIAGGASYTHAKDLPEIGLAIVDTLNGKGTASFGWAKSSVPQGNHNQPALLAHADFKELERQASQSAEVKRWKESRSECYI